MGNKQKEISTNELKKIKDSSTNKLKESSTTKITGNLQRSSLWQGLTILLDFWPDFLLMRPCSALWESQASVYKISFRSCPSLLQLPQTNIASNHLNQSHQRWQAPYFLPKARVFGKEGK